MKKKTDPAGFEPAFFSLTISLALSLITLDI